MIRIKSIELKIKTSKRKYKKKTNLKKTFEAKNILQPPSDK